MARQWVVYPAATDAATLADGAGSLCLPGRLIGAEEAWLTVNGSARKGCIILRLKGVRRVERSRRGLRREWMGGGILVCLEDGPIHDVWSKRDGKRAALDRCQRFGNEVTI